MLKNGYFKYITWGIYGGRIYGEEINGDFKYMADFQKSAK